jgi:hypothetical protein
MAIALRNVRFRGQSGHDAGINESRLPVRATFRVFRQAVGPDPTDSATSVRVVPRSEQVRFIKAASCHIDLAWKIRVLECELRTAARAE